ncbi:hypothetical protein HGA91_02595 [candidate division WWE3 bacterium]|nr:hypothetical protein [candidate division WWE3 bacterium]
MALREKTYQFAQENKEIYMFAIFAAGLLVIGFHFLGSVVPTQDPILSAVRTLKTSFAAQQK